MNTLYIALNRGGPGFIKDRAETNSESYPKDACALAISILKRLSNGSRIVVHDSAPEGTKPRSDVLHAIFYDLVGFFGDVKNTKDHNAEAAEMMRQLASADIHCTIED
ncbi:hypothetical protein [uncultured Paraglaciecola sp.]|uniref:hypothetical protein n=1 Tax=uncultured Paraglaciecola sp. TaxID=1765024 RepID=UPI00260F1141|nr:hypothetical protein [uncultured Paraglaciecola sp.]